jgi:hypothetical protein
VAPCCHAGWHNAALARPTALTKIQNLVAVSPRLCSTVSKRQLANSFASLVPFMRGHPLRVTHSIRSSDVLYTCGHENMPVGSAGLWSAGCPNCFRVFQLQSLACISSTSLFVDGGRPRGSAMSQLPTEAEQSVTPSVGDREDCLPPSAGADQIRADHQS